MKSDTGTRSIYVLLLVNVVTWGMAWPLSKIGLAFMTPIWYTAFRFIIGSLVCFLILATARAVSIPKRQDLPILLGIGVLQMALYLILVNSGLAFVGAGRSAILAYSTPLWVTPLAALFFRETITRLKVIGVLCGLIGVAILFAPMSLDWSNKNIVIGNSLLLLSALIGAISILQIRFSQWHSNPFKLLPWQLLLAAILTLPVAYYFEPVTHVQWNNTTLWTTLAYNGVLATAFGYWASITVFKNIPAVTSSLCYLGVPVLRLLFSAVMLGETISASILSAMMLIVSGIACVALSNASRAKPASPTPPVSPKIASR